CVPRQRRLWAVRDQQPGKPLTVIRSDKTESKAGYVERGVRVAGSANTGEVHRNADQKRMRPPRERYLSGGGRRAQLGEYGNGRASHWGCRTLEKTGVSTAS